MMLLPLIKPQTSALTQPAPPLLLSLHVSYFYQNYLIGGSEGPERGFSGFRNRFLEPPPINTDIRTAPLINNTCAINKPPRAINTCVLMAKPN